MTSVPMLRSETLARSPGVRHAFFTRNGGVSAGIYASLNGGPGSRDAAENVAENRRRMADSLAVVPERLLAVYQVHSPDVITVEAAWPAEARPRADAMVTKTRGLALGITSADCGPVLFADAEAGVIGAAHAGWRGALSGVLEAAVAAMERLGARRRSIAAALGPTIGQANYEVGRDLIDQFRAADPDNVRFFADGGRPGHAQFDLPGFIAARLMQAGIGAVDVLACCTYAEAEQFFSYRRATHRGEADYGRQISAIALAE